MEENCGKGRMAFRPTSHPKPYKPPHREKLISKLKALMSNEFLSIFLPTQPDAIKTNNHSINNSDVCGKTNYGHKTYSCPFCDVIRDVKDVINIRKCIFFIDL